MSCDDVYPPKHPTMTESFALLAAWPAAWILWILAIRRAGDPNEGLFEAAAEGN